MVMSELNNLKYEFYHALFKKNKKGG